MTHPRRPDTAAADQPPPHRCRTPALGHLGRRHRAHPRRLEAIICDLHVIVRFAPAVAADIETRNGIPPGVLLDTVLHRPTAQLASVGAIDYPQWLQHVRDTLPGSAVDEWLAYHGHLNQPAADLLTSATLQGVRLLLSANTTPRLRDDLAFHDLGDLAAQTLTSYEIGYAKPDPRAYEHMLRTTGLDPTRALCIETDPSWLPAAAQLGLPGHHYRTAARLRHELARAGAAARPPPAAHRASCTGTPAPDANEAITTAMSHPGHHQPRAGRARVRPRPTGMVQPPRATTRQPPGKRHEPGTRHPSHPCQTRRKQRNEHARHGRAWQPSHPGRLPRRTGTGLRRIPGLRNDRARAA